APTFNDILVFLHEDDRKTFSDLFTNALQATKSYEMEFRIYNQLDGKMRWAFLKGEVQPLQDKNKPFRYFSGIMMDITEQKKAEEQLSELQQKLLLTARQAGMSEIAASVLHNIGNILNSVNISISVIKELLEKIKPEYLKKTVGILQDSLPENSADFTNDTKGKLAFNYILEFSDHLNIQLADINKEISVLNTNVQHIKSVLHMQNAISGVININEKVSLNDAIDYAIQIGCGVWEELEINIIKSFKENITLMIDKSKLLQILINLMKNAKETVILSEKKEKNIIIEITQDYDNHNVSISIRDNGIGIESENLTKIFSLGYTTKKEGHGFGLHGSANTAKELGGSLRAESTGRNEGAVFILSLPNKEK
ncbi:MAG: ATP-binding protein, partial [Gammaproteobacteria bacterium]